MKGQALILAIAVLLVGSLLIYTIYQHHVAKARYLTRRIQSTRAGLAAEAGIEDLLRILETQIPQIPDTVLMIDEYPFEGSGDSCQVSIYNHQGYIGYKAFGSSRKGKVYRFGKVGASLPEELRINLGLVTKKPLVVPGQARIRGRVVVPVDPQFVGGTIEGFIEKREFRLPPLNTMLFDLESERLKELLSRPADFDTEYFTTLILEDDAVIPRTSYINGSLIARDWQMERGVIATTGQVEIEDSRLKGCTIVSSAPIVVTGDSRLNDCELYAPRICVDGHPVISGTIFTPELIVAGGKLSGVTIYTGRKRIKVVQEAGVIAGGLFAVGRGTVEIEDGAVFRGLIHSLAPVSLKGSLEGYLLAVELRGKPLVDTANRNVLEGSISPYAGKLIIPPVYQESKEFVVVEGL